MIRQSHQQKLLQKLSPQQIQLMKLLQVPTASLEDRVKEELVENPALELASDSEHSPSDDYDLQEQDEEPEDVELSDDGADKIDFDDFLKHEDHDNGSDYSYESDYYGDQERPGTPVRVETSFHESLLDQLRMLDLDENGQKIAQQVIGSLDEDGYLRRETHSLADDLAFSQNTVVSEAEIRDVIRRIQQFDPPGIAASTLQECLLLQLQRMDPKLPEVRNAVKVIDKYFTEFTRKHYDRIQRQLGLDDEGLKDVIGIIIRLNPKPGAAYGGVNKAESYIIPDFFIFNNNGRLELTLNARNAPELRISEGYREMIRAYDRNPQKDKRQKEALLFIKQKLDSAKWFIDAIRQRQHTLLQTMQAILNLQQAFFLSGDDTTLKPMILKDISQITGLDISTVSRVVNSKFVQTEFGTYKLKYFFSEGLHTESGEEVSTREVKSILNSLVSAEEKRKPLSDDKLAELLQEKGYNIARRTVAKYREQLNIPVARLRREL